MSDLRPYAVFAEIVSAGSMTAAARRLGMTPSAVSQTIRALERQTGVTLLHRSTRKLSLTEAGERCYPHCRQMLEAASAASDSLIRARDAPSGELRIAAPLGFAPYVAPALAAVLAEWPHMGLRLIVDDAMIDLIEARIDIALRVGQLADSNWITRKLCDFEMALCAAPAYIERHGMPLRPGDLPNHQWIALSRETVEPPQPLERPATLTLELLGDSAEREQVDVAARITSTNQVTLRQMCEQGLGIARLFHPDVHPSLESGELVRVLPQWRFRPLPVAMITPSRERQPAKVRIAADALRQYFGRLKSATKNHRGHQLREST